MRIRHILFVFCLLLKSAVWGQPSYKYRYWFDGDGETEQVGNILTDSWHWNISIDALEAGLHFMHLQVQDDEDNWSVVNTQSFVILPSHEEHSSTIIGGRYRYWFDGDLSTVQTGDIEDAILNIKIPMDGFDDWMHLIHWQVQDVEGIWSPVVTQSFAIIPKGVMENTYNVVGGNYRYWFDGDLSTVQQGNIESEMWNLQLSVDNLSDWLHQIHFQIQDEGGIWSPARTEFFVVVPQKNEEDKKIKKFEYWVNDNTNERHEISIDEPNSEVEIIKLLPVEPQTIRSSKFEFAIEDEQPRIYAKNELNVIFHDASDYFTIQKADYVDTKVSQNVTNVVSLTANQSTVTSNPKANEILWFKFDVEAGDTIAFRTNRASSLQVFAPNGSQIYQAEGDKSVTFGGAHVWEDGTCYLALHDMTSSYNSARIDFMHMDKYAIVNQDIQVVGNEGCSTITFNGNGFRDLYGVDLYNAEGDTIHAVHIGHESDATTSVVFDFANAELGKYNAVFRFAEENKQLTEVVTVEDATDIELTTDVTYPSAFLKSSGKATYKTKIHNSGNMTSYRTPIHVYISSRVKNGVSRIKVNGLDLPNLFDGVENGELTAEDKVLMTTISQEIGDTHYFVQATSFDETINDSVYIWAAYFFTDIAPESTKSFSLEITSSESVEAWITVPNANNPLTSNPVEVNNVERNMERRMTREEYCCIRDRVECVANLIADGVSIADKISDLAPGTPANMALGVADCVSSAINELVSATGRVMCDEEYEECSPWERIQGIASGLSTYGTLFSCASEILPVGDLKDLIEVLSDVFDNKYLTTFNVSSDISDCVVAFTEKKPNCPVNATHQGGRSLAATSLDPNDIYGYLSETGSKFMADSVAKVNYTIEFENDPEFATAPAHTIVIKDTLDSRYFDLPSFVPVKITIGNHEVLLEDKDITSTNGVTRFIKTIDMRPEIYAIAQVEGLYNQTTGIAQWTFTSLDPMTMETAEEVLQGILPINYDGTSGIGEVMFEVGVKSGKTDGTAMQNQACIIFDTNDPIMTPIWMNTVDAVAPSSNILGGVLEDNGSLTLRLAGEDNRSGVWKYNVYAQFGAGTSWEIVAENLTDTLCNIHIYEDVDYSFMVMATDSAGNVEQKSFNAEYKLTVIDGKVAMTIPFTMTSAGVGTLILPFNAEVPEGLSVYKATGVEGSHICLTEQAAIAAGTPLIVLGEVGTYTFKGVATAIETEFTEGVLTGTTEQKVITEGYVLQRQEGVTGFYRVDAANPITVPAYRCWLLYEDAGVKRLLLNIPTHIQENINSRIQETDWFDLEGRRSSILHKGIYVQKGNKKTLIQ